MPRVRSAGGNRRRWEIVNWVANALIVPALVAVIWVVGTNATQTSDIASLKQEVVDLKAARSKDQERANRLAALAGELKGKLDVVIKKL